MTKKFYITSAIPYVNAKPHIGHALEFVQTDVVARYHKLLGEKVTKLCGGDENALKNVQAAEKEGTPIQEFVDKNNTLFEKLAAKLNAGYDIWQKGSDQKKHYASSQKLWKLCKADIYQKKYKGLYCIGCETFYTQDELNAKGECFEHPGKKLEEVEEKNYFFTLSNYQNKLINLIQSNKLEIVPEKRRNEVLAFLKGHLDDISISRTNERARNWGVPVPGDPDQRIYVWFDALNIYQSGIGFGWDNNMYQKIWPADVHVIGKGILRFHAVYWPAFLLSAGLKLPKKIFVHEYFTVNGQKMSKTLGNVVDPAELIVKYAKVIGETASVDGLRYYLLGKFSPFSDGDFSEEKFREVYNSDLANGLGNLVARVTKLCENSKLSFRQSPVVKLNNTVFLALEEYRFDNALEQIWTVLRGLDQKLSVDKPWTQKPKDQENTLQQCVDTVRLVTYYLKPFLPQTAEKLDMIFTDPKIKGGEILFPRLR